MTVTLAHLSDLHFGTVDPALAETLLEAVHAAAPDLTVISGDLTQRARDGQFRDARAFIDRLPQPVLCVPGNHDIPLENLPLRALAPWRGWRRRIGRELEPSWRRGQLNVVGVNTVHRFYWQRGRISRRALDRACAAFEAHAHDDALRVLVAHHPFEHEPGDDKTLMRGAGPGLAALSRCGTDVVLSGHLHSWRAGPFAAGGALQIHAGTTLSRRLRGEANDFNLLVYDDDRLRVERHAADEAGRFALLSRHLFLRGEDGWRRAEDQS